MIFNTDTFTHHGVTYEMQATIAQAMAAPMSKAADIIVWYMPQGPQLQELRALRMAILEQYL